MGTVEVVKRLAVLSGLAIFAATTLTLHFLQPTQSPLDDAVSYYVHGNQDRKSHV